MKTFISWLSVLLMVLLFTLIIDISIYAPKHSVGGKTEIVIVILLSVLLCSLVIRTLFILTRKNKNKR